MFKKLSITGDCYKKVSEPSSSNLKEWGNGSVPGLPRRSQNKVPLAPMFIPRTPGGKLLNELKTVENNLVEVGRRRIRLVEEGIKPWQVF